MSSEPLQRTLLVELMAQAPYQPATNYWRCIEIAAVIRHGFPTGHGLDLGCGDGHLTAIVLAHVGQRDLIGVDIDPQETAIATARGIHREVVTAPGDQLPFSDCQFDFAYSNSVLEHIEPIDATLRNVSRVLKPGGRFLFTVPGPNFHACLKVPRSQSADDYFHEVDARCAHLRYWNLAEWSDHLLRAGLEVAAHSEYLSQSELRRWDAVARNTSGILYRLVKKKQQPIQIQRQLGMRSKRVRLPKPLAAASARFLDKKLNAQDSQYACLLIEARKR